jgi:uncharacterized membrane-anchored protein
METRDQLQKMSKEEVIELFISRVAELIRVCSAQKEKLEQLSNEVARAKKVTPSRI